MKPFVIDNRPEAKPLREQVLEHFVSTHREAPHLTTTKGDRPWAEVQAKLTSGQMSGAFMATENDNEVAAVAEYWEGGALIHRSVHVHLKRPYTEATGVAAALG